MKKIICCVAAIAMLTMPVLSGCSKNEETAQISEFKDGVVATVGDVEVSQDVFDFYVQNVAMSVQQQIGSAAGWENIEIEEGKKASEYIVETALDSVHTNYTFLLKAQEMGIYSDEDKDAFVAEQLESYGGIEALVSQGLKEEAVRDYLGCMGAYYAIAETYCTQEQADAAFADYISAKHILITFEGDGTGDDDTNTLAKAQAAYDRAKGGESFEDLINELGSDPGQDPETGYVFGEGEMVDEFYQAAKSLEIGAISEPVRTDYGYHVIKRYELPAKGTESYDTYIKNIRVSQGSTTLEENLDSWKNEYPIVSNSDIVDNVDWSVYTSNDNSVDASAFDQQATE